MRRDQRDDGGDHHRGAATPRMITARTVETARPDSTGVPHHTTPSVESMTSDPLWPLVTVLGDIARHAILCTHGEGEAAQ